MKNNIIVGNLKMNLLSVDERDRYVQELKKAMRGKRFSKTSVVVCPPFIHSENFFKNFVKNKSVEVGAQNVFWEKKGSYTGEVSPEMLRNIGCEYVILGHSERRKYFSENNSEINLKVRAALKSGLKPILCVGESVCLQDSATATEVKDQMRDCLAGVKKGKIADVIICYEPVWAISSNNPDHLPTADEIMGAKLLIKNILVKEYGIKEAEKVKIIYGGSVSSFNVKETCIDPGMDGALVGKESLTPRNFVKIAEAFEEA